jgi:hypothetical protein
MTREKGGQDASEAVNDNQALAARERLRKEWLKKYMREFMRKKRERLRAAKAKAKPTAV